MSVSTEAHPQRRSGVGKLWLGLLVLVAAGVALAWVGADSVRSRTVQVETIAAGSGPLVKPQDGVLIDYEGRLEDGKVFDSSAGKGPVPVLASQTIPGFTQALMRMQEGGRYKVHIPAKLGYGHEPPAGGPIPPDAALEFDIHIARLVPNAALMQQMQQAQAAQQGPEAAPPPEAAPQR